MVGVDKEPDAKCFVQAMRSRLEQFELTLHPEKTQVIRFGRFAAANRAKRGLGKPQTFDFLGFTHISGHDRRGKFMLQRITRRDRMVAALKRIKEELRRRWHISIQEQGKWLRKVVQGTSALRSEHGFDAGTHVQVTGRPGLRDRRSRRASCRGAAQCLVRERAGGLRGLV